MDTGEELDFELNDQVYIAGIHFFEIFLYKIHLK